MPQVREPILTVYSQDPFRELWEHDRRQRGFASQEAGQADIQDTPMIDPEE
jgi:hypothetical protein